MQAYPLTPADPQQLVAVATADSKDDVDVLGVLDTLFNSRGLIAASILIALLTGAGYVVLSKPVYQADLLIQVEQNKDQGDNNVMGALATAFNIQSPATAEMEILKSRLVVGRASDHLGLHVTAEPKYFPLVGRWFAQHAPGLPYASLPWLSHYAWGPAHIQVRQFELPEALYNKPMTVVATATGYALHDQDGVTLAQGAVGKPLQFNTSAGPGSLDLATLSAAPGTEFRLVRHSQQHVVEALQKELTIQEKNKPSGVLAVSLQGSDPARVATILNTVGDMYVEQNTRRKAAEAEKSLSFLDSFLPQLRNQMDDADSRYTAFRDKHGTFDLGTEGSLSLNALVTLQTQLFELQQSRRQNSTQFGPDHPTMRALAAQINAAEGRVAELNQHIRGLPELEQQLLNLQRDSRVTSELYATLLNSTQQLRLIKEGKVGNVRVVDPAIIPENPVRPDPPLALAIAGVAGLFAGIALALLRGMLGSGVRGAGDIEMRTGMHVYATVPKMQPRANRQLRRPVRRHGEPRVLARVAPDDPAVESLRSLRTSLHTILEAAPNNIVMIAGPTADVGKTFTSLNLAAVLGAADKKVLLIDTDLRGGALHTHFGLKRELGLVDILRGEALDTCLHASVLPNVDLITTGRLPVNPAEILLSERTAKLIKTLESHYDVVVFDTAPLLPVSDALALAPLAGTLFMLARADQTTLEDLGESAKRLRQVGSHVNGVILNDFNPANHRFSSRYGSGYSQDRLHYTTHRP
ncbi:polysaccharide biosynthesis tyrosine autokinase [Pusillimonas sp. TS35]|nr:polysaccharide biosynthesis tyrosine autokinase [Pusillimonas sp. TS35]